MKFVDMVRFGVMVRERNRMYMLNDVFDDLCKVVFKFNFGEY